MRILVLSGWMFCLAGLAGSASAQIGGTGWSPLAVQFNVQSPTNVPRSDRHFFTNNIYHCLVYSNDGAFSVGNTTLPRTEQRFTPDYTNGEIQYQAMLMAPSNENSYCVFQIHTGDAESQAYGSTTFMLFWFTNNEGSVHDYSGTTLATDLGNQWFQLNVDHNLFTHEIMVWVNQQLVWTQQDNGAGDFYMKDGVYEQGHNPTYEMDTYITNSIKMWVSSATNPPSAPVGLVATPGTAQIGLTWNASVNANSYSVKRSMTSGGPYSTIATLPGTNYLDTGVAAGITYYYVVTATDQFGESSNSAQVAASCGPLLAAYWTNTMTALPQIWNLNANWTNSSTFPNGIGQLAVINAGLAAPQIISLNQSITLGSLQIGDANGLGGYTLAANGGSLIFNGASPVLLTELASSKGDVLATPVSVVTSLIVDNYSTNALVLAGTLTSSSGGALTLGGGALQIGGGTTNGSLGSLNVTNNGALVFNRSDDATMSGVISGSGTISQSGTGVLTLSGTNVFSGNVTVFNGTLKAGNASALGSGEGSTLVANGATLDVNGAALAADAVTLSGAGVNRNGVVVNSGGQQTSALREVTLAGDVTFGGANRWDIRDTGGAARLATSPAGSAYSIAKVGTNQVSLVGLSFIEPMLGDINIEQGELAIQTSTVQVGNPANAITVYSNAILEVWALNATPLNKKIVLSNGATLFNESGSSSIAGTAALNGNDTFNIAGTSVVFSNQISGAGNLIKTGLSPMVLAGTNLYTGDTVVSNGTLALIGNCSISNSAIISIAAGAVLDVSGRSDGTLWLAAGQVLDGFGAVNGALSIAPGATVSPGSVGETGILAVNGAVALQGATLIKLDQTGATNDVLQTGGVIQFGGELNVTNVSGTLAAGDGFRIFSSASCSGSFSRINPPTPGSGLAWDLSDLANGNLKVIAAPPPQIQSLALLSAGNLQFVGGGGSPNANYYLLMTTNLASPSGWTCLQTDQFDNLGGFDVILTNALQAGSPRTYYRLQLP